MTTHTYNWAKEYVTKHEADVESNERAVLDLQYGVEPIFLNLDYDKYALAQAIIADYEEQNNE